MSRRQAHRRGDAGSIRRGPPSWARPGLVLVAAALGWGCRGPEVTEVELPEGAADFFFLLAIDRDGRPARISAAFGASEGRLEFGGAPRLEVAGGDRALFVVGLPRAALLELHGGFDTSRQRELALSSSPPPDRPRAYATAERSYLDARLPALARFGEATGLPDPTEVDAMVLALRDSLTLTVPVDPEYCHLEGTPELSPFGDRAELLPLSELLPFEAGAGGLDSGWHDVFDLAHADRDRIVVLTRQVIAVVRRGEAISIPREEDFVASRPSALVPLAEASGAPIVARRLAIDRSGQTIPGTGETRVLVVGMRRTRPAIFELGLSAAGLRYIGTATVQPPIADLDLELADVAFDDAGNELAAGPMGLLFVREAGRAAFYPRPRPEPSLIPDYRRLISTGDPGRPHLLASDDGSLYLGDALTSTWHRYRRRDRLNDRRFYGLAAAPEGGEFWAVGPKATLFRLVGEEEWTPLAPILPPSFLPCSGAPGPDGQPSFTQTLDAVELDAHAAYLLPGDCFALLRVRRADLCASALTIQGRALELGMSSFRALDFFEGQLALGGAQGGLYSVDLSAYQ